MSCCDVAQCDVTRCNAEACVHSGRHVVMYAQLGTRVRTHAHAIIRKQACMHQFRFGCNTGMCACMVACNKCMRACTHAYMHVIRANMLVLTCMHAFRYLGVCVCVFGCACVRACMYAMCAVDVCMRTCMHSCIYAFVHATCTVCIYIYIYIYNVCM